MWPEGSPGKTSDTFAVHRTPVSHSLPLYECGRNAHTARTIHSNTLLTSGTALSCFNTCWVAKSLQSFQKGLWSGKLIILKTAFLSLSFEDLALVKRRGKGDQDCLQDTRLWLPALGRDPAGCTSVKGRASDYKIANMFSILKETINQSITPRSHIYSFQEDLQGAGLDFLRCLIVKDPPG